MRDGDARMCLVRLPVDRDGLHCIPLYDELPVAVLGIEHVADGRRRGHAARTSPTSSWSSPSAPAGHRTPSSSTGRRCRCATRSRWSPRHRVVIVPMSIARLHQRKDAPTGRSPTCRPPRSAWPGWSTTRTRGCRRSSGSCAAARSAARAADARSATSSSASGRPSWKPAADWTPTTARSWSSARVAAPAYVQAERTPEQISSMQVLDAGAGRVEVHPRGRDALLVEALAGPVVRRLRRRCGWRPRAPTPCRRTPCRRGPSASCEQVAGRLVGAGEPGADHHRRRAGGERERDVARVAHSPVGPDVLAEVARGGRALEHGGELRPPDAGHHPGRAHRARARRRP